MAEEQAPGKESTVPPEGDGGAARPEREASPPAVASWPSDALPLWILAGIVLCYVLHFGQERFRARGSATGGESLAAQLEQDGPRHGPQLYDLRICNHTAAGRVYVAVAYYDPAHADWLARGWFAAARGECKLVLQDLTPPVYVHAESRDGQAQWGAPKDGRTFCIGGDAAFAHSPADCGQSQRPGVRLVRFKKLELSGHGRMHTWELTP